MYKSKEDGNDVTCHAVPVVLFLFLRDKIHVIVKKKSTTIFHGLHSYRPWKWRHKMFKTLQRNHSPAATLEFLTFYDVISMVFKSVDHVKLWSTCQIVLLLATLVYRSLHNFK